VNTKEFIESLPIDKQQSKTKVVKGTFRPGKDGEHPYPEWKKLFWGTAYDVDKQGCLCKIRTTKDGGQETIRLANFTARICREVVKDDGQASQMIFEIDGILSGGRPLPAVNVLSSKFSPMAWPVENWGAAANILPGSNNKDSLRHAIQTTGFDCVKTTVYTHTGWRQIGSKWIYLHGAGAIGDDHITTDLEEAKLTNYALPAVIDDSKAAATLSLDCLSIAPDEITLPLLATIYLAPLCEPMRKANYEPSFIVWLSGMTGARKSTISGLFLSHFGHFSGKALPGSFKDTENTLERKAFLLKDTVFCVDDYHPVGSANEKRTMEKKAHSLIRGYGDRVGRGRMRSDISLRESYIPRGLCIVTGEDVPNLGQSATARLLTLELKRDKVDLNKLTALQSEADKLTAAMAGYIKWLSPQMNDLPSKIRSMFPELRKMAAGNAHGRIPETAASLYIGVSSMLSYFAEIGAITEEQQASIAERSWQIFMDLADQQGRRIYEDAPAEKFLSALRELITARKVTVRHINDLSCSDSGMECIGWKDDLYYYLLPGLTYNAVCQFYHQQGGVFSVGESTLWKHLEMSGMIYTVIESGMIRRTPYKRINGGIRERMIHLKVNAIENI